MTSLSQKSCSEYGMKPGDLVSYGRFALDREDLGIVLQVAEPGVQPNGGPETLAEVLWCKYATDGPQWYRAANLEILVQTQ